MGILGQAPSPGWLPVIQSVAVIVAGCLAAILVHRFTIRRERDQALRKAYAEFGAAAFKWLRWRGKLASYGLEIAMAAHRSQSPQKTTDKHEAAQESAMDASNDLRSSYCTLVMLLGSDRAEIRELDDQCERLKKLDYRHIQGKTEPLFSTSAQPTANSLGSIMAPYRDEQISVVNMREDMKLWLTERADELSRKSATAGLSDD